MDERRRHLAAGAAAGAAAAVVLAALTGLAVVAVGGYPVAATEQHAPVSRWALDTNFHNAVEAGARDLQPPARITPAMLETGASHYKAMCQHCHGGPGAEREEWAQGMRPRPPHLSEAAAEWEAREVFWLAKHGVRMTGMPAFGPTHSDEELWAIAAFVKELPGMTAERYAAAGARAEQGHGSHAH